MSITMNAPRGTSRFTPYFIIVDGDRMFTHNNTPANPIGELLSAEINETAQKIAEDFVKDYLHNNNGVQIYVLNWTTDNYNCLEVMLYDYGITCVVQMDDGDELNSHVPMVGLEEIPVFPPKPDGLLYPGADQDIV